MKITSVDVFRINDGKPSILEGTLFYPTVVRINTDEGISGFGELGLAYGNAHHAAFGIAMDFSKLIIGMDPMNNEEIWEKIFRKPFWGMGGGTVIPNFLIHEQHAVATLEENIKTCKYDYQPKNGFFEIPDRPGIGQELTEEAMQNAYKVTIK